MRTFSQKAIFLFLLFFPAQLARSQDPYRTTRSREVQQAIGHVAQAEYYTRMALRSIEASEKTARAPFFDYKKAKEDLERILGEFKIYLSGDGSPARAAAIPVVIDGRYFAESIKEYFVKPKPPETEVGLSLPLRRAEEGKGKVEKCESEAPVVTSPEQKSEERTKEGPEVPEKKADVLLSPPAPKVSGDQTKRERIGEILKKGL